MACSKKFRNPIVRGVRGVRGVLLAGLFLSASLGIANATTTAAYVPFQTGKEICDLSGKVINITDGDTLRVLDKHNQQHKIRLAGIDAPEKRQAFGKLAKIYLSAAVKHKIVCISGDKRGRYGRIIGTVYVNGKDINLDLVQQGFAWHYKKYQKEQTPLARLKYADAEIRAQQNSLGLWHDEAAIAPWNWRKQKRLGARVKREAGQNP